ncbi:odorant receptor 67a-like isoform X2 [Lycorma delicatula]|uniref:odorant receptor 67a-like isoform X2 n=1 Tax=Lycorma delicatula TaxID=130591 RepID=UPI003F50D765
MCVFLYLAIETNNTFMSIGFLCSAVFESLLLYAYCIHGQRLIDEYDELRRSLAECSWVDKPQWFKKMLLIMMTRSNAPVCIKPFGIYIINLENFIKPCVLFHVEPSGAAI